MPLRLTVVKVSLLPTTPAVIFWLWLLILPVRMDRLCPEGCNCDPKANKVLCHYEPLNKIPVIFPRNVQKLSLYNNSITNLENDAFISRGLTELKRLEITRCELETIEVGAFNGLTKLKYLLMEQNYLSEILPRTFEGMSSLKYLKLRNNRIEYLNVNIFSGLINLSETDLSGNNLQSLHPHTFVALPKLQNLNISHNLELQIPTDSHFISSLSLRYLFISKCNVISLSAVTFANVTALEWLDISYNYLTSVGINILKELPNMSALYLYGNPLQCDCQLQEVWRWCQDHNIETAYEGKAPECDTPSEVRGIWWGVLEKGQCLQDTLYCYEDGEHTGPHYNAANVTNTSDSVLLPLKLFFLIFERVLYTFGTAGTVMLLIIIIRYKDMRTVPNMYILNLAIIDIVYFTVSFFLSYIPVAYGGLNHSPIGFEASNLNFATIFTLTFCYRLLLGVSAYSIVVLSIQRYRVTVNPFHVRVSSQPTRRNTVAIICAVWGAAALLATPACAVLFSHATLSWILNYIKYVVIYELLVFHFIPVCVIAYFYTMTARHLLKSADPRSDSTQNPQMNTRKTSAKILLGLTFAFLISTLPFQVLITYYVLTSSPIDRTVELRYVSIVASCLLLLHPCLNPVAVFCTSSAFRRKLKRYFTCRCKAKSSITDFELTRRN